MEVTNLTNKRKKIKGIYFFVSLLIIFLGIVAYITKKPTSSDEMADNSTEKLIRYENVASSTDTDPNNALPNNVYEAIADDKLSFEDYTLAEVECESGTLTLDTLQYFLKSDGCMTGKGRESYTYTFANSKGQAVIAEFDNNGICIKMYRVY